MILNLMIISKIFNNLNQLIIKKLLVIMNYKKKIIHLKIIALTIKVKIIEIIEKIHNFLNYKKMMK